MLQLSGESVIVTGGGSGIGRETALSFADHAVDVLVGDVDADGGQETVSLITDETDADARFFEVDVTDEDRVETMVDAAVEAFGRLDYGVNNAGVRSTQQRTADVSADDWKQVIDVNLTGVWHCLRAEIRQMRVQDGEGAIVNTSSILGQVGSELAPAYTAAKHGVLGVTKAAALDYATEGVRVNAVCPGYVETQMVEETGLLAEDFRSDLEEKHAMERLGTPEEVASAIVWLCSDGASFTTGEAVGVDGGYLAR